jgi:hypothetical protein
MVSDTAKNRFCGYCASWNDQHRSIAAVGNPEENGYAERLMGTIKH